MARREMKREKPEELNLLPVMALFAILIPVLISVAAFQKLGIVDVNLPQRSDVPNMDEPPPPDEQNINLTVAIVKDSESGYDYLQIVARGGMLPMVFYKEMHTYRCKSDGDTITYDPAELKSKNQTPKCRDGSEAALSDLYDIQLWTIARESEEDPGKLAMAVYNKNDSAYVDGNNNFVNQKSVLQVGSVFATLKESSGRKIDNAARAEAQLKPLSAYDELAKTLIGIHNRFIEAPDADNIIVLADDDTPFDKVIKVMDRAREAGFTKISLAKLGGV